MSIVFDYLGASEFCRCVEKAINKNQYIDLSCDGQILNFFAGIEYASVVYNCPVKSGESLDVRVDSNKFLSIFKKLYDGDISVKFDRNKVTIKKDNITATLPSMNTTEHRIPKFNKINGQVKDWVCSAISKCYKSISKTERFDGVMIDNSSAFTRISRLSGSGVRIVSSSKMMDRNDRVIVSSEFANVVSALSKDIHELLLGKNLIGVETKNGVMVYMSLLYDGFPQDYIKPFGLRDDVNMLNHEDYNVYSFNRDELLNAIDTVSSIIGVDEPFIYFQMVGYEAGSDTPVWRVSGKSSDGCEIQEDVACNQPGPMSSSVIGVNRINCVNVIKLAEDNVFLYDREDKPLVISDLTGSDVALLVKVNR